jgi:hypothetical protein
MIVINATNPYSENFELIDLGNSTSSEEVAKELPGTHIVKAFNTMCYETPYQVENPRMILVCFGSLQVIDADAKSVVSKLI